MSATEEYVLVVSCGEPHFCIHEKHGDKVRILTGLMLVTDRCPGKLIGVYHEDGQEAVEEWCRKNPNWYADYAGKRNAP